MMCLGWHNRPSCKTRPPVQMTPAGGVAVGTAAEKSDGCANWFWLGLAVVGGMALSGGKK